jgi:uncharacterized protein (AIM24 family)
MSIANAPATIASLKDLNADFLKETLESDSRGEMFEVVSKRFLRIDVEDYLWIKLGSVVAFHGDFKLTRERILGAKRGILAREFAPLVKVEGKGRLYCADEGKRSHILRLEDGTVNVVSSALLAFESAVHHEARLIPVLGLLAGGIFAFKLAGTGVVVIGSKGDPLTLRVTPDNPVITDPDATLAWSGGLTPELKTQLEWRMMIGHGGGEAVQMLFRGDGYVVIHGKEDDPKKRGLYGQMKSMVKRFTPF